MSEQVRVETVRHRTPLCVLTFAVFAFLPLFAYGQCKEPANPKTAVAAPKLGAAIAGAVQPQTANAATEFGKTPKQAPGHQPIAAMMYKPPLIEVPDLSNKTLEEVEAEVANKLTIRTVNNSNPGWIVRRQFPERKSNVQICSALDLWMVEPAPQMTRVPKIVGLPETQIPGLLEKYHLKYAGSRPRETNELAGTIVDQDPKPETPEPWNYEVIGYKAVSPPPTIEPPSVHLTADATSIKPGDTVTFVAKLEPYAPGAQFVFDFGDGQSTTQEDPEVPHRFDADRDYEVTVTAKLAKQQVQSELLRITVHPMKYTLDVTWIPRHPAAGQRVVFTATLDPPNPAIAKGPYYFSFGEKSKPKPSENIYRQSFARPGPYSVRVRLNGEHGHIIESLPAELLVIPEPPPPPSWWKSWGKSAVVAAAIVLVASFVGLYGISKYLTGLVAFRAMGRIGSVHLRQDGRDGLEAAFGISLERPTSDATAEFRGPVVLKVERIR